MTSDKTHIIVGASLTGAKAAETLRREGFDGRVVLVGAEDERPDERPPVSKEYIRGDLGTRQLVAFWLVEDRVVAGMNVNVWDVTDAIKSLINERVAVDDRHLADADVPLDKIASAAGEGVA